MAAKSAGNVLNSFLFTKENGRPMVFVITPGEMKTRIRPLIENCGGVVTSRETPGATRLVEPDYVSDKKLVTTDFIFNSFEKGVLENIDHYRLQSKPQDVILLDVKPPTPQKGRKGYSAEEDQAIVDYVTKYSAHNLRITGNKLWKEMEKKNIIDRPWQSMRSHYLAFLRHKTSIYKGKIEFKESNSPNPIIQFIKTEKTVQNMSNRGKNVQSHLRATYEYSKKPQCSFNQEDIKIKDNELVLDFVPSSLTQCCDKKIQEAELEVGSYQDCIPKSSHESTSSSHKVGSAEHFKTTVHMTHATIKSENEDPNVSRTCTHKDLVILNSTEDTAPVLKCEQLFENFKELQDIGQKLFEQINPTPSQILRALYVSSGCLKEAICYMETGLLLNGQEGWTKEEDTIIKSGNDTAIRKIIIKRGQQAVDFRKQFLTSF